MRVEDLAGRRVAIWGLGAEGRASLRLLTRRLPDQPLAVLDEAPLAPATAAELAALPRVTLHSGAEAVARLAAFEVVVKSPGVSLYRQEIVEAKRRGVVFTSATDLWFGETPDAVAVCVTGSKGKSTTAALLAHLLRAAGRRVELAGNIGRPVLDLVDLEPRPDLWVLEISSYQAADLEAAPSLAVLLNLYPEHLEWHGSVERYFEDKLRLLRAVAPGRAVLNRRDEATRRLLHRFDRPAWFNDPQGFHADDAGWLRDGERRLVHRDALALLGRHNLSNVCAALTVVRCLDVPLAPSVGALPGFRGLAHRLRPLGERDGVLWVDDSISTIPESAAAAIEAFADRQVTLLLGGHDRGLDYRSLTRALVDRPVDAVVTMAASGPRIAAELRRALAAVGAERPTLFEARDLPEAVELAREVTPRGGVVLLSPAAASYGDFADYRERGRAFARAAGFGR